MYVNDEYVDKEDYETVIEKLRKLNDWYRSETERIRIEQADLLEKSESLDDQYNKILRNIIEMNTYTNCVEV